MTISIFGLVVALIVLGIALWAIGQFPIDATILRLIRVVVIVVACLWVLQALGLLSGLPVLRLR